MSSFLLPNERTNSLGGAHYHCINNNSSSKDYNSQYEWCYNYNKKGYYAQDCWYKEKGQENATSSRNNGDVK